jgi:hypothetical protein
MFERIGARWIPRIADSPSHPCFAVDGAEQFRAARQSAAKLLLDAAAAVGTVFAPCVWCRLRVHIAS